MFKGCKKCKNCIDNIRFVLSKIQSIDRQYLFLLGTMNVLTTYSGVVGIFFLKLLLNGIAYKNFEVYTCIFFVGLYCAYNMISNYIQTVLSMSVLPAKRQEIVGRLKREFYDRSLEIEVTKYDDPLFLEQLNKLHYVIEEELFLVLDALIGLAVGLCAAVTLVLFLGIIHPLLILFAFLSATVSLSQGLMSSEINRDFVEKKINYDRRLFYFRKMFSHKDYVSELQVWDAKEMMLRKHREINEDIVCLIQAVGRKLEKIAGAGLVLNNLLFAGTCFLLAYQMYMKEVTIGTLVAGFMATQQLTGVLVSVTSQIGAVYQHSMLADGYVCFEKAYSKNDYIKSCNSIKHVSMKNVTFVYPGSSSFALKEVNLIVSSGMQIALVGKNGAGKSTIAKIISGLYQPTKGVITYDGIQITANDSRHFSGCCSCVFQSVILFETSIAENILMEPYDESVKQHQKVMDALEFAGLTEKVCCLPHGILTTVTKEFDKAGVVLSGGEMQRLALARVYAHPRPIMILDEASASLDVAAEKSVIERIKKEFQNIIVIWISHREECLLEMDEIFCVDEGRIVEHGTYGELLNKKGLFYELYGVEKG